MELVLEQQDDMRPVGIASNADEASDLVGQTHPHVVLMDISLASGDGIDATRRIKAAQPDVQVVVLTGTAGVEALPAVAEAGAAAFVRKEAPLHEVLSLIRTASDIGLTVDRASMGTVLRPVPQPPPADRRLDHLTPREEDVLQLLARGLGAKAIAQELGVQLSTCRGYIKSLLLKLGVHSQLEAVVVAVERGLLPPLRERKDN
jgi:DNA-binding NarL/FixJ family response regulator